MRCDLVQRMLQANARANKLAAKPGVSRAHLLLCWIPILSVVQSYQYTGFPWGVVWYVGRFDQVDADAKPDLVGRGPHTALAALCALLYLCDSNHCGDLAVRVCFRRSGRLNSM